MEEVNWLPLSNVMTAGRPNLATQLLDEGLHAGVGVHGGQGDGLQPPAAPVDDGEQVPEALFGGGEGPHQVPVDVREPLGRYRKGLYRRRRLPGHLGVAEVLAVSYPFS